MPSPVDAVVTRTSGRFGRGRSAASPAAAAAATSIARSWAAVRWAPGRSPLLTTTRSATSSRPALIAWTSSPISGASRTTVVSAAAATSTSLWPVPTVSIRTRSKPAASRTAPAAPVVEASPPAWPRAAIERMNTSPVAGVGLHPDPVAEERAAGDRAGRVDRDHRHGPAGRPDLGDERRDEGRLARPGRTGDADEVGAPGAWVELAQRGLGDRRAVLDRRQQPGEGATVAGAGGVGELGRSGSRVGGSRGRLGAHPSRAGARWPGGTSATSRDRRARPEHARPRRPRLSAAMSSSGMIPPAVTRTSSRPAAWSA